MINIKKFIIVNILYFFIFWVIPLVIFGLVYDRSLIGHLFSAILVSGQNFFSSSLNTSFFDFVFNDLILLTPLNFMFLTIIIPLAFVWKKYKISGENLLILIVIDILIALLISYFIFNYLYICVLSNSNFLSF